ncbi:MAG: phosphoglucosamine mutase, partial [Tenericutes bacterium]|nr:phosphoglucosamine mutase [Mycoplasmatota bacterium]
NDLKVVFDLANGSSSVTAPEIFNKVLKNPIFLSSKPNGININDNCGSTHLDNLINYVKENKFDLGIAFDGDADRCLFVDEDGNIIDGDFILAIVSLNLKKKNKLKNNTLVGTILSNLGLIKFCNENDINFSATKVGDRYVLEEMILKDYVIGGEQSGHIIFKELATTGDGELTALQILSIISEENKSLKECSKIMKKYPQVSRNIKVKNEDKKEVFTNDEINNVINKSKDILKDTGRIIVRPSGTEPLIRVMIEGNDLTLINNLLEDISCVIENKIGIK